MNNHKLGEGVPVKFRILAAVAIVVCFAVFFQNCGMSVRFASLDGKLMAKNVSVESENEPAMTDGDGNELEPTPTQTPTPTPDATATPEATSTPEGTATPDATSTPEGTATPGATSTPESTATPEPTGSPGITSNEGEGQEPGPLNYVCILEGPGRSIVLGYMDNVLGGSKSTPDTICTTKRGCEEIASRKFNVKEALQRSYCESNKNVIRATEDVLSALVGD